LASFRKKHLSRSVSLPTDATPSRWERQAELGVAWEAESDGAERARASAIPPANRAVLGVARANRPYLIAFNRETALPSADFGPVDLRAFIRFASIRFTDIIFFMT
jgi:hypothetical protein